MLASTNAEAITAWIKGEEGADEQLSKTSQSEARSHVIEVARRQGGPALARKVEEELDAAEPDAEPPPAASAHGPGPAAPVGDTER
jgi:hypothetical protein